MANFIGLDLGTTTVTAVLLDAERDEVLSTAQRCNDSPIQTALPTRAEQDAHRLRDLALEVLAELVNSSTSVDGIALTGQMHGLICVDGDGQPLTPLMSWQDRRTAEPLPDGSTALARVGVRLCDLPWQENGCRIAHGYGAAILFWLVQQGELPPTTQRVCTLPDWLAGQLTGCLPVTDPTLAASWGVFSLMDDAWNRTFLERLGLNGCIFPPVSPSGERLGGLVPGAARGLGLPSGVPVFNAIGDNQASFLGSVADRERTVLFNLGTGGQICWQVPEFETPDETLETRPLPGTGYLRVGASLCGGAAYAWLNRTVRTWLAEFGLQVDATTVYERLDELVRDCKDPEGLRVRPTFLGVRGDPAVQAGAIEGITPENLWLGALARATLNGMVDELRDLYWGHVSETVGHTHVVATGGGVRKNPMMPGLIRERFGMPVRSPQQSEIAAIGAARMPQAQQH